MSRGIPLGKIVFVGIIVVIALGFFAALAWIASDEIKPGRVVEEREESGTLFPVTIRTPSGHPTVDSGEKDAKGNAIMVNCATCHDTREPNYEANNGTHLKQFHQGLLYQHGGQSCLSCHNAEDYNTLKRADGKPIDFSASMKLCAQCHGTQFRDYENGIHGGMTGYWDLSRGGRERNTCIDCHDPHKPAYPKVMPVFPPKPVRGEDPTQHKTHE